MQIDLRGRLDRIAARFPPLRVVLAVQDRYSALRGNQLAAAITLTAFLALFALVLIAVAVVGFVAAGSADVPARVVDNLGLSGDAATTVKDAINKAEQSRRVASVVGFVGLLWAGLGVAAALAYAYNSAWHVPGRGLKDRLVALLWMGGSAVIVAAAFAATASVRWLGPIAAPIVLVIGVALNAALWLWTSAILPNRHVHLRALLPAAVFGAVGLEVLKVIGTLVVPHLVRSSSALYGSIGVVFAILLWLLVLGRLVVYVAVIEVLGWERRHGTVDEVVAVPRLPHHQRVAHGEKLEDALGQKPRV
jgi:membrane protein